MKFLQPSAIQNHIESSLALQQSLHSCLVVQGEREERRAFLLDLGRKVASHGRAILLRIFEADEGSKVLEELLTSSFLGKKIVIWDGVKKLSEDRELELVRWIRNPSDFACLLMGSDSYKPFSHLYEQVKQELVLLDMTGEKPWEKEKRLRQELSDSLHREHKTISPAAIARFFSVVGHDALFMQTELDKLLCYVGDKKNIEEKDVKDICSPTRGLSGWPLAERLLWENVQISLDLDITGLLGILGQVRFLAEQAKQVNFLKLQGKSNEEVSSLLQCKPTNLVKVIDRLQKHPKSYIDRALSVLFKIELLSKNGMTDPDFLFDLLRVQLTLAKRGSV